jgi:hypothetical protein
MPLAHFDSHLTHDLESDQSYIKYHRPVAIAIAMGEIPAGTNFTKDQMIRFKRGVRRAKTMNPKSAISRWHLSTTRRRCLWGARYLTELRNIMLWNLADSLHRVATYLFRISA